MSKWWKIELVIIIIVLYAVLFINTSITTKNMDVIKKNNITINKLKRAKDFYTKKVDKVLIADKIDNSDIDKYVLLLNKSSLIKSNIDDLRDKIDNYKIKIEKLDTIIKDN
jgi:hypothetical protein